MQGNGLNKEASILMKLVGNQIGEKVKEAKTMGVKESLVLVDDAALIVSAKNNTVITAMNRAEATAQIFTNINGTILMD